MGEIEPLSDTSVTSGICELCMEIEMAIIAEYHAQKRNLEQAIT